MELSVHSSWAHHNNLLPDSLDLLFVIARTPTFLRFPLPPLHLIDLVDSCSFLSLFLISTSTKSSNYSKLSAFITKTANWNKQYKFHVVLNFPKHNIGQSNIILWTKTYPIPAFHMLKTFSLNCVHKHT